jgi:DNA-binding NtrC family response regulator
MDPFTMLKRTKTLLVDDDELIRDAFGMAFRNKGCFLRVAKTAEEGLMALEEDRFDSIVCDYNLPGLNGLEFFHVAATSQPGAYKVLISGRLDPSMCCQVDREKIDQFFQKPFSIISLAASLAERKQADPVWHKH